MEMKPLPSVRAGELPHAAGRGAQGRGFEQCAV